MPWGSDAKGDAYFIWGATAAMLRNLYRSCRPVVEEPMPVAIVRRSLLTVAAAGARTSARNFKLSGSEGHTRAEPSASSGGSDQRERGGYHSSMSFFAVLLALLLEQIKPLPRRNVVHESLASWVGWTGRNFDAGKPQHAKVVWLETVIAPSIAASLVNIGIFHNSRIAALFFDVVVLYLTLGVRQFSHYLTDIRDALDRGDEQLARQKLAEWRHLDASELPRTELLRHMIEHSLRAAHRHVFGVFFSFVVFSAIGLGPAGAVLYRMAEFASRYWAFRSKSLDTPINENLMALSQRLFSLIDHIPARLTAAGFAVRRQLPGRGRPGCEGATPGCGSMPTKASSSRPRPAPSAYNWAAAPRRA